MIEKVIMNYLHDALRIECFMEKPETEPDQYILIERFGRPKKEMLNQCTIAIQSHDLTLFKAAELNEAVKKAMENITILSDISSCKLNSDQNFTNPKTNKYRYQALFDLIYY